MTNEWNVGARSSYERSQETYASNMNTSGPMALLAHVLGHLVSLTEGGMWGSNFLPLSMHNKPS